ncbi:MAG TPA: AAA family ATPase, partial [Streptosporangiaceae bacterium]
MICLAAPEAVQVPRGLLRADGRSIYRRHGGVRYAARAQLAVEDRLVAQAGAEAAPRLARAGAARALGAGPARLEDALAGRGPDIQDHHPERSGLTADQAAAVLSVLTDGERVSVINAPAGSGKTRVLAEAARVWAAEGRGPVAGITPSQSARNTLAAGVAESCNTARFLGHLPGQRGARGPLPISEGTLLLVDEASMIPTPDLSDLVSLAGARGGKVVLAGDAGQLQAVENGGAMSLLAGALGYARLADPVRFRAGWEQAASLRLRAGD